MSSTSSQGTPLRGLLEKDQNAPVETFHCEARCFPKISVYMPRNHESGIWYGSWEDLHNQRKAAPEA